jgi:hypothetical protein
VIKIDLNIVEQSCNLKEMGVLFKKRISSLVMCHAMVGGERITYPSSHKPTCSSSPHSSFLYFPFPSFSRTSPPFIFSSPFVFLLLTNTHTHKRRRPRQKRERERELCCQEEEGEEEKDGFLESSV